MSSEHDVNFDRPEGFIVTEDEGDESESETSNSCFLHEATAAEISSPSSSSSLSAVICNEGITIIFGNSGVL